MEIINMTKSYFLRRVQLAIFSTCGNLLKHHWSETPKKNQEEIRLFDKIMFLNNSLSMKYGITWFLKNPLFEAIFL